MPVATMAQVDYWRFTANSGTTFEGRVNVDTPQTISCVEWCFGYGGNHLGLKRVLPSLRCLAASEIEGYAIANLVSKIEAGFMDPFPVWTDVKTFPCEIFRDLVDIFIASYPCTPFSASGKRKGKDDPRHLWPFVRRAVEIIRPRFCFFENVEGHVSLGLREVLTELALLGYRVENSRGEPTWGIFSAAEESAPQGRKRVFILASREGVVLDDTLREQVERFNARRFSPGTLRAGELANDESGAIRTTDEQQFKERPKELSGGVELENSEGRRTGTISTRPGNERLGTSKCRKEAPQPRPSKHGGDGVAITNSLGSDEDRIASELRSKRPEQSPGDSRGADTRQAVEIKSESGSPFYWPGFVAKPGQPQYEFESPRTIAVKRGLGGGFNGRSANVDRLRLLGNGVYPASAANAFATLFARLIQ